MDQQGAPESDPAANQPEERRSREREALRRRVHESLLRCPGGDDQAPA